MKFYFLTFIFLASINCFGQKKVFEISNTNEKNLKLKEVFLLEDESTQNLAVFFLGKESNFAYLYTNEFEEIGAIKTSKLSGKFTSIIGYFIENKKLTFLFNTINGRSYGVVFFDFETGLNSSYEIDFKLKKENYIGTVSNGSSCYMLSASRKGSKLNVYTFNGNNINPKKKEYQFNENEFTRNNSKINVEFYYMFRDFSTVEDGLPNPIDITSTSSKLYMNDSNSIVLSSDKNRDFTYIVNLDLKGENINVQKFSKPMAEEKGLVHKTNSFIYKNNLYQIAVTTQKLEIQVTDIVTNEVKKEISVSNEEEIKFKNTPIILEGGELKKYRELDRTKQFLRKINQANVGITVYSKDDVQVISIGGVQVIQNNYGMIPFGGGFVGGMIAGAISGALNSYLGYSRTKSVFVTGMFDANFNHLEGTIPLNIFDEINSFSEDKKVFAESLIKYNDGYLWGSYDSESKTYKFYKF